MTVKSIIIVGAGLAGLSTGCFAQMNGYRTKIFEMQDKPGGVCVSWKRKGYVFDYAVHNLFGVTPNSVNNHLWQELGALKGLKAYSFEEFVQVEDETGKIFTVYTELDKLEKHMKELSPSDQKLITEYIKAAKRFSGYDLFAAISGGIGTKLKMIPLMGSLMKYSKITIQEYSKQFTDPFLRKAFATIQYDIPEAPVVITLIFLATMNNKDGGWPISGAAALSANIDSRYKELGGEVFYRSKVSKILVEGDKAVGVRLEDGTEHFADLIISAADGHSTIYGMLDGKYVNDKIKLYYEGFTKIQPFGLEIWYGVSMDLSKEPHALVVFQKEPLVVEDKTHDRLDIEVFGFDPTLAAAGKTVVKVVMNSDYDYWKSIADDLAKYNAKKQEIADAIAERLESRFPGFAKSIEAVDVVTPISVEHWTGAYRGCQAWGAPKEMPKEMSKDVAKNGVSKTLPGLDSFYMVGQWAGGTIGLNTVCLMGRNLVRDICKIDKKSFKTQVTD